MGLDSIDDIDSGEVGAQTSETKEQQQEKKDRYAKSLAGIGRTQKDEKKAKKDNDNLINIIIEILKDPQYDILIPFVIDLLKIEAPSNFILGTLSLIYSNAALLIRKEYSNNNNLIKNGEERFLVKYSKKIETIEFSEENLEPELRKRINEWIEDIYSIITFNPSTIVSKRFLELVSKKEKESFINLLCSVLTFFFYELNIVISKNTGFKYADFILGEIKKKVVGLELEEI